MRKKILIAIFSIGFLAIAFFPSAAQEKVDIFFFYGNGCPHCAKEEKLLKQIESKYNYVTIYRFEIWKNQENAKKLSRLDKELGLGVKGVPVTIVGDKVFSGYYNDETTGQQIINAIEDCTTFGYDNKAATILGIAKEENKCIHGCAPGDEECLHNCGCTAKEEIKDPSTTIKLPVIGQVDVKKISLPVLTVIIGAIDGFNPCAMWVLIFLISLLLGMKDRKKMWILGSAFIIASGAVYFLFMTAWLNLFLFVGYIFWIRLIIAFVAIGSGAWHIYNFYANKEGTCKVTGGEKRRKVFDKLKSIVSEKHIAVALIGIVLLAFAVNLVEIVCSAGLPAVYTQILSMSDLATWQYYAYILLYVIIFMLDDMIIFVIAMVTLNIKAENSKYTRWMGLIGGVIILVIGILLIFKPQWLMFG